ncbi:MAG: tRNA lysidine(34) synthetase TilS [Candidatus Krumholzibacteriia bacterium]
MTNPFQPAVPSRGGQPTPHPFLDAVLPEIERLVTAVAGESHSGPGLLVALSGGPDSVALLRVACVWAAAGGRPLVAAHLNHRLRGAAADADEAFCRDLCAGLGVPLHVERADPRPLARERGQGLEEAGRVLRRRWFRNVLADRPDLAGVATGHHRDDQVETVVMRLFRGTGIDGLAGIRPRQGRVLHPLLGVTRVEILAYLDGLGQPYRRDATNVEGDATRTRVRRELLPLVRAIFGPAAAIAPARLAALAAAESAYLDELAAGALASARAPASAGDGPAGLSVTALLDLPPVLARRVLRVYLGLGSQGPDTPASTPAGRAATASADAPAGPGAPIAQPALTDEPPDPGLSREHLEELLQWLRAGRSGQSLDLPGGRTARREFDTLHVTRQPPSAFADAAERPERQWRISVEPQSGTTAASERFSGCSRSLRPDRELTVPADALSGAVRVRGWRAGDAIAAFGLGGHKKVSDLLRERRIPRSRRHRVVVVEDGAGILWIPGIEQAERTRLLPSTRRTVTIRVVPRIAAPAQERAKSDSLPGATNRTLRGKDREPR